METYNFKNVVIKQSQSNDDQLLDLYLNAVAKEPKPEDMSNSLYLTCLTLKTFEQIGNKFPSQKQIDVMEKAFKRYSKRKSLEIRKMVVAA